MEIQHESHDHPLVLNEYEEEEDGKEQVFCYGCKEEAIGSSIYSCLQCNFHLHKSCAELPYEIQSILHPKHTLYLFLSSPNPDSNELLSPSDQAANELLSPSNEDANGYCSCCSQLLNGFSYGCNECSRFNMHPRCLFVNWETNSLWIRKEDHLDLHRIHQHPLVFIDELGQETGIGDGKEFDCCVMCRELITSGPIYSCPECTSMRIHKSCADLPLVISNPFKPSRQLFLFAMTWNLLSTFEMCIACKTEINGFFYGCLESDDFFDSHTLFHIECSSGLTNDGDNHRHEFIKLQMFVDFTCRSCGEEDRAFPWICTICHILVHRKCSLLPQILKVYNHQHSLYLKHNYLPAHSSRCRFDEAASRVLCKLCYHKVNPTYATYCCLQCNYIAHLDCALEECIETDIDIDEEDDQILPNEANLERKDHKLGEETNTEFSLFSHPHKLALRSSEELEDDKYCVGCLQLIAAARFYYYCTECDFYLHERCAKAPTIIRHPLHPQHNLSLSESYLESFHCNACGRPYPSGFFYNCGKCRFAIDIRCSSFLKTVRHPGHEHPLMFAQTRKFGLCSACGVNHSSKGRLFVCTECDFRLGFKCGTLPLKARHKHDGHLLNLTYVVEDESGEYYCDICEEERESNHWFYHCGICLFSAHPECVFKNELHGVYDGHRHPLKYDLIFWREEEVYCGACNIQLRSPTVFTCIRSGCDFHIHAMGDCFDEQLELKKFRYRNR